MASKKTKEIRAAVKEAANYKEKMGERIGKMTPEERKETLDGLKLLLKNMETWPAFKENEDIKPETSHLTDYLKGDLDLSHMTIEDLEMHIKIAQKEIAKRKLTN